MCRYNTDVNPPLTTDTAVFDTTIITGSDVSENPNASGQPQIYLYNQQVDSPNCQQTQDSLSDAQDMQRQASISLLLLQRQSALDHVIKGNSSNKVVYQNKGTDGQVIDLDASDTLQSQSEPSQRQMEANNNSDSDSNSTSQSQSILLNP